MGRQTWNGIKETGPITHQRIIYLAGGQQRWQPMGDGEVSDLSEPG